ncbi:MAG: transcription termination/antitermination protein NusG [bacterium]
MTDKKWYIVQTYSGYENKAKIALEERIKTSGFADMFEEIFIPMETVVEMRNGKRREVKRKFYNGYIFVKMELDDNTWHTVKNTPKIVGFVGGSQTKPTPVPEHEVKQITQRIEEGTMNAKTQVNYSQGDKVKITEGNFKDFTGTVEEVDEEKERLKVYVQIFGRPTSVEFSFKEVTAAVEE